MAASKELGRLIRHAREDARLSHRELAKKAKRSTSTAVRAEVGRGTMQTFRDLLRPTGWKLVIVGMSSPKLNLGRALAACRLSAGLSWAEVAAKAGLCAQSVRDCERDVATSTASTVAAIARALRLRIVLAR